MKARSNLIRALLLFCTVLAGLSFTPEARARSYTIAVIPKGTSHEFWKSIHAGAVKAQRELAAQGIKVNVIWKGPLREDERDSQIQVVENFIGRRVDGIVLAPLDSQALIAPVETATQLKIPVVIIDSGLKSDKQISYVSTDNFKGGQLGAEALAKFLNGRGNVILLRYQVGSASTEEREAGFVETIKKYPEIKIISSDQYAGATRESAYQAAQNLLTRYGKEVNGIFTPNESTVIGVMLALRDANKAGGVVKLVGFDTGAQSVEGLKKGDLQGLVVQNPMRMGYLGVLTVIDYLNGKPIVKRVDTGVQVVTQENMNNAEIQELLSPPLKEFLN